MPAAKLRLCLYDKDEFDKVTFSRQDVQSVFNFN